MYAIQRVINMLCDMQHGEYMSTDVVVAQIPFTPDEYAHLIKLVFRRVRYKSLNTVIAYEYQPLQFAFNTDNYQASTEKVSIFISDDIDEMTRQIIDTIDLIAGKRDANRSIQINTQTIKFANFTLSNKQ